jgi:hypothetical protein
MLVLGDHHHPEACGGPEVVERLDVTEIQDTED